MQVVAKTRDFGSFHSSNVEELIKQTAEGLNMPYMTERWLGGTLTNFITIRKLTKKITSMDKMMNSTSYMNMAKKERLMISRDKVALDRVLGGILDLTKLPGALVVVDIYYYYCYF